MKPIAAQLGIKMLRRSLWALQRNLFSVQPHPLLNFQIVIGTAIDVQDLITVVACKFSKACPVPASPSHVYNFQTMEVVNGAPIALAVCVFSKLAQYLPCHHMLYISKISNNYQCYYASVKCWIFLITVLHPFALCALLRYIQFWRHILHTKFAVHTFRLCCSTCWICNTLHKLRRFQHINKLRDRKWAQI